MDRTFEVIDKAKEDIKNITNSIEEISSLLRIIDTVMSNLDVLLDDNGFASELEIKNSLLEKDRKFKDVVARSVYVLKGMEYDRSIIFRILHREKCKNRNHYIYDITNSIEGSIVKMKCPVCGEEICLTKELEK